MSIVDRILYNGNIHTLDRTQPHVTSLAITGERIVAYGTDAEIQALAGLGTTVENLNGRTVIPGLIDAHIHWQKTAESLQQVNLFDASSRGNAVERVAKRAATTVPGEWVRGWGWAQDEWPDVRFPTAADLDAVTPNHPVYLTAKSYHAGWANSLALKMAGVDEHTPDPEGGQIARDANGKPTGLLLESAMWLVSEKIAPFTIDQIADRMRQAQDQALALGVTGFHDFDPPTAFAALQRLRERGELRMRAVKNINVEWIEHALELGLRWGFGDDWLRIGGLKIFADGALGPRTAAMFQPYDGEPNNYGIVVTDKEEMVEHVSRASAAGFPATIHAIGDKAVHDVLDVYETVRSEEAARGENRASRRHRIEHVQLIHPDDAHRLAQLDIIVSMQPIHATSDYEMSDRYWGARSNLAYNPRIQLDQGVVVAFGSDSPVDTFNPFAGIHAAVTRRRANGTPGPEGWYPAAKVTVEEALRGYTEGPAYAAGLDTRSGHLSPGYLADLVVIDRDLMAIPGDEILETRALATMVGGQWKYQSE